MCPPLRKKWVPSPGPTLLAITRTKKNQHAGDAHCGRKASHRLNRHTVQRSVEHERATAQRRVGRNGLLLNAERPEPPTNCDRRGHWTKATTALFVWREPGTITPRPSQVKATLARPKRAPRLGFYDVANQEDQWPS